MSDERDETVFQPSASPPAPGGAGEPQGGGLNLDPASTSDEQEEGTVFAAASEPPSGAAPVFGTPLMAPIPVSAQAAAQAPPAPMRPASGKQASLEIGTVLNHMFEIKRFLARGGMGEVFEGVNIASGERVAIKTILPELSADPKVMAMFRKEAQALTELSHPAVVRYRGYAMEPELGFYYIATGFISGQNLSDIVGKSTLTEDELAELLRRLAEGLREAHELGVVHRDISPDNVILDSDRLDRPKIIDFGIVKETDPGSKTIIGDGFAGKPSYVAPEQLGDFDKQIGPWSDVYSLGLVILALAQGRKPDLGGLPAEAIMKRRNGIDTSSIPPRVRKVVDQMLVADSQKRLRSMDAVITALDQAMSGKAPKRSAAPGGGKTTGTSGAAKPSGSGPSLPPKPVLIGGGALLAITLLGGIGYMAMGGGSKAPAPEAASSALAASNVPIEKIDAAVQTALPSIPCSWMTVDVNRDGAGVSFTGSGVAGAPLDAENGIIQAAKSLGVEAGSDFTGIARIDDSFCPVLDELNKFRAGPPIHITRKQPEYELDTLPPESYYPGQVGAKVITDFSLAGISGDFALYSIEKSNVITPITLTRAEFQGAVGSAIQRLPGDDTYRMSADANAQPGWAGVVLITGSGGFTKDALSDLVSAGGKAAFEAKAKANGWKVQIVWYKFVDSQPNAAAGGSPATTTQ
ncbi:serine/threonine protein kinase [Novosphingobium sp.]|uniref:serine/threonine protein kinase n=1 Tax=Novosphingobium sp. TaxID=1874826 RepID=UPI003BA8EB5B